MRLLVYISHFLLTLICLSSRQSSNVVDGLKSYKEMIETTTNDLETYLESIDEKLENIIAKNTRGINTDAREI